MESNKYQNLKSWIGKIFSEGATKALADLFSYILKVIFFVFIVVVLAIFNTGLQKQVVVPFYMVLILSLFAAVGVFVPVLKIKTILDEKRTENKSKSSSARIVQIHFEELPRLWSSRCIYHKEKLYWDIEKPDVFCSIHNLKLELKLFGENMNLLVSTCPECEEEGKIYYPDQDAKPGFAVHKVINRDISPYDYRESFINLIKNRILRELDNPN